MPVIADQLHGTQDQESTKSVYEAWCVHGRDELYVNSMHAEAGEDHSQLIVVVSTSMGAFTRVIARAKHINIYVGEGQLIA